MANIENVLLKVEAEDQFTATFNRLQKELSESQSEFKRVERELKKYTSANDSATGSINRQNKALNNSSGSFRIARSGMAQLGYQIQDVAVQMQGGQNLGIILGQQGSQIASIFGPGGVVAGAFISVGALIGTMLVPQLFKAKTTTKELADEIMGLADSYDVLTDAQKVFLIQTKQETISQYESQITSLQDELIAAADAQANLNNIMEAQRNGTFVMGATAVAANLANQVSEGADNYNRLSAEIDTVNQKLEKERDAIAALREGVSPKDAEKAAKDAEEQSKWWRDQLQQQLKDTQAAQAQELQAQQKAANDAIALEEMLAKTFADIEAKKTQDAEAQAEWRRQQLQRQLQDAVEFNQEIIALENALTGNLSNMAGAFAANLKEGTAAQRAFLAIQKGFAVAQALMNMQVSISEANKMPIPAKYAAIAGAISTGLSAIAGVKAVSFEGGGYTGMGIRAGGLDGRGGMPAIVHPNETIIDHSKGQGMGGVTVNFTIQANDTAGFDRLLQSRRGQIISMINQAVNNRGRTSLV